jgi:hypothetical protein
VSEIFFGVGGALHLHQADGKFICHEIILTRALSAAAPRFCPFFLCAFVLSISVKFNTLQLRRNSM